jgi:hypothetical protein
MAVSRGARLAWIIGGSVFTVVTIGFGTLQAVAGLAHERRTVRSVVDAPVQVIDIEASGSVTVLGRGGGPITVTERVSDGLHSPERERRVDGARLVLRGTCPHFPETFCSDDFVIRAPRSVQLNIRAEGITLTQMRGGADLTSDGGNIWLRRTGGTMRLRSHGGDITGTALDSFDIETDSYGGNTDLAFAVSPHRVDAASHGGDINLILPDRSLAYRVDASAMGGSTDTLIRTDPDSPRVLRTESFGGDITVRYAGEPGTR